MVAGISISVFFALSVAEHILLVEDTWDNIACVPETVTFTEAVWRELDTRPDAYKRDSAAGSSWDAVKARISPRR